MKDIEKTNASIDILKLLMALLVVGIHTEPFGFNIWLDRGFGIITRLCVPFFFVSSAYFYWTKEKSAVLFLKRIILLYVIWSIIYFPSDISSLSKLSFSDILRRFLWDGNEHALWFLCASAIGFVITFLLLKVMKPAAVLCLGFICLLIGCMKSTWAPMAEYLFSVHLPDFLGSRNGLFYAFPYMALGMSIAKRKDKGKNNKMLQYSAAFALSLLCLAAESVIFVVIFKTSATILWISVFPCTYFLFMLANNLEIKMSRDVSLFLRKMSTIVYLSQYLFIPILESHLHHLNLFICTSALSVIFAAILIRLSEIRALKFLRYLY